MLALLAPLAALPWLTGFFDPQAATERASPAVIDELAAYHKTSSDCIADSYGGFSLRADVAPNRGSEQILASYSQGVYVLDSDRHVLAHAAGFACAGSSDELVAIAAGDALIGTPLIALAVTSGGRAENATYLTLYRVAGGGELQPVFIGEVERHVNRTTRTGVITIVPGGLIFVDPAGTTSLWIYDAELGRYIEQVTNRPFA
jgi:hypothetical protein